VKKGASRKGKPLFLYSSFTGINTIEYGITRGYENID
jgi:hypothetical protein